MTVWSTRSITVTTATSLSQEPYLVQTYTSTAVYAYAPDCAYAPTCNRAPKKIPFFPAISRAPMGERRPVLAVPTRPMPRLLHFASPRVWAR